jgi:hypothetical protein
MEDRVVSGRAYSFYRSQISGLSVATIYTRGTPCPLRANWACASARLSARSRTKAGFCSPIEGGWDVSFRGASPLPDEVYTNLHGKHRARHPLYPPPASGTSRAFPFYSEGRDTFENQPVDIVDITDATGFTVTVSFNQSTKLPVRQTYRRRNPLYRSSRPAAMSQGFKPNSQNPSSRPQAT